MLIVHVIFPFANLINQLLTFGNVFLKNHMKKENQHLFPFSFTCHRRVFPDEILNLCVLIYFEQE